MKLFAIKENHLYGKAYTRGARFTGRLVSVYFLKDLAAKRLMKSNPQKKYLNRVGISVSKKLGGAVVRNRVKRIVREAYRNIEKEGIKYGMLIVISGRQGAVTAKSTQVTDELRQAFAVNDMLLPKSDS